MTRLVSLALLWPCILRAFARNNAPDSFKQPPSRAVDAVDPYVAISCSANGNVTPAFHAGSSVMEDILPMGPEG